MGKLGGLALMVTGFIACPCHLPFTFALLTGVLGGTGVGAFVSPHLGLLYGLAAGYFVFAIALGYYMVSRRSGQSRVETCPVSRRAPDKGVSLHSVLGAKNGEV